MLTERSASRALSGLGRAILTSVLAGMLAVASIAILRGAQSVHPRPEMVLAGADADPTGMAERIHANETLLDGSVIP